MRPTARLSAVWFAAVLVLGWSARDLAGAAEAERIEFHSLDDKATPLVGHLLRPAGAGPFPAIILLHGCGGLFDRQGRLNKRHRDWADRLVGAGYVVLFPDSFNPRGVKSVCADRERVVTPRGRAKDALGAAAWLRSQDFVAPARVGAMGWSNGGSTVLRLVLEPKVGEVVVAAVAFYPGCRLLARRNRWKPAIPLLIQIGEADDWTPAEPCRKLATMSNAGQVKLDVYAEAYHDFDAPDTPVRVRKGVAFSARGNGVVHVGTNEAARQATIAATLKFFAQHLGAGAN